MYSDEEIFEGILGGLYNADLTNWLIKQGYLNTDKLCTPKGIKKINEIIEKYKSSVFESIKQHQEDQDRTAMFLDAGLKGVYFINFVIDSLIDTGLLTEANNGDLYIR